MSLSVYLELLRRFAAVLAAKPLPTLVAAASLLSGCNLHIDVPATQIYPTLSAAATPVQTATSEPAPSGWETLSPGLERRIDTPQPDNPLVQLVTLRIDPAYYRFRVVYRPGEPLALSGWQQLLPEAAIIVNGNFFNEQDQALGLVVADGIPYGASFQGFGGLFQVQNGTARVRSTIREPYGGEALEQALQAFPMLMLDGAASYEREDSDVSRRTLVAQDSAGRILLMATPLVGLTLPALSAYLPTTDMGLTAALNLDGGRSTLLGLRAGSTRYTISSFDAVPTVLAVYPR